MNSFNNINSAISDKIIAHQNKKTKLICLKIVKILSFIRPVCSYISQTGIRCWWQGLLVARLWTLVSTGEHFGAGGTARHIIDVAHDVPSYHPPTIARLLHQLHTWGALLIRVARVTYCIHDVMKRGCQWRHKQFTEKAIKNVVNTVYEGKENLVPRCRNIYRSSLFYTTTKRKQKSLLFKPRSFWLVYWKAGKSEKQRREAETQIRLRRVKHLSVDVCCPLWLGSNTKAVGEDGWMAFCDKIVATDKQVEMNIIFLVKPCW